MTHLEKDIAIIGAGPSGLFTVFEAGMLGYSCAVVDSLPQAGGQLTELYPEKPIYDIPGYPTILAGELAEKLLEQAAPFAPTYVLGSPATALKRTEAGFELTAGATTIHAKVLVIAAGGGMFAPRKPALENLEDFEASSIFYAVKDKQAFAGKTLAIAGGGDSAVDWAVALAPLAKHVHVIHRRDDFRAAEETVSQMKDLAAKGLITIHTGCQLKDLHGKNGALNTLTLARFKEDDYQIEAENLLCFFGLKPELGPLESWGLELDPSKKIAVDPATMATNQTGILAIGDMCIYPGKLSLILTGFAEAALAAKTAQQLINPEKKFKLIYSTSKGVPENN